MRVICINDKWDNPEYSDPEKPVKGEIYSVLRLQIMFGLPFYELAGFSDLYRATYFVEISDCTIEELVGEIPELQEM